MTTCSVAVDVAGLRAAAGMLREVADTLGEASRTLVRSGTAGADGPWLGLAALEQASRRAETATALQAVGRPVLEVATGLERLATVVEDVQARARRYAHGIADLEHEHGLLLRAGPPPEPVGVTGWQARLDEVQRQRARLESLLERARAEVDEARRQLAVRVEQALGPDVYALVGTLALLHDGARRSVAAWRAWRAQTTAVWAARRLHRLRGTAGERSRHVVASRLQQAVRQLKGQPPGWLARVPVAGRAVAVVASRGVPLMVLPDALPRVVDGGGHDGVRGVTTRVLAGAAVVGVVAAVASPGLVVGGALAVGTYQAWRLGSWAYDNRQALRAGAGRAWSTARDGFTRGASAGRELVGRAGDRARSGVERLRRRWASGWEGVARAGALP